MKVKFASDIKSIQREGTGDVRINFTCAAGVVQDAKGDPNSKLVTIDGSCVLRLLHAQHIRFGDKLKITLEVDGDDT